MADYSGAVIPRSSRFHSGWDGPVDNFLYLEGAGENDFVEGFSSGSGSVAKNADHLNEEVSGNALSTAQRTWVTDAQVDLTDFATLKCDWGGSGVNTIARFLVASTDKTADKDTFDARETEAADAGRVTNSLDVSALSGDHYIRVHVTDQSGTSDVPADIQIYQLWLEP